MLDLHSHTTTPRELVSEALAIVKTIATGEPDNIEEVLKLIDREEDLLLEVSESELLKQIPNSSEVHSNLAISLIISQFIASGIPSNIDTDMVFDLVDHVETLLSTVNDSLTGTIQKENDNEE